MIRRFAILAVTSVLSFATGCATTQQQQQNEEGGDNAEQENQGNGNNVENVNAALDENGAGNNSNGNVKKAKNGNGENNLNGGNNEGLNPGNEADLGEEGGGNGEFVNNADSDAFDQGAGNGGNNAFANNGGAGNGAALDGGAEGDIGATVNNATEPEDFGTNAQATNVAAVPVEQPAVDTSVNSVVDQSGGLAPAPAADPLAGAMPGAGVVRYVLEGGTQLYSDQERRSVVKNLEQGDHPLVVENGEWARTSDGYYVSSNGLTARPIGRFKPPAEWQ